MNNQGCVYRIENTVNGRVYIGATTNLLSRVRDHWRQIRKGRHMNELLGWDAEVYGADKFIFSKILTCSTSELYNNEQGLIYAYHMISKNSIYNCMNGKHENFCLWTNTSQRVLDSESFNEGIDIETLSEVTG